jgi:hypothetical protein
MVATRYHHEVEIVKRQNLSADLNQVVDIVMLGNLLIHALKFGNGGHNKVIGAPNELLVRLQIHPQGDLPTIIKSLKLALEMAGEFIKMIGAQ